MEWFYIYMIVILLALWHGNDVVKLIKNRQDRKRLEAEARAKRELEAQRFDQMKSLLTDAVVSGDPNAVKALAPIAEAMAEQIRADTGRLLPAGEDASGKDK
jgi:hypothetical protein